jgi:hypothetical protein
MKKGFKFFSVVVIFLLTSAFTSAKLSPIDGSWSGAFKGNAGKIPFQTHFWTENAEIKGTIDFPQENTYKIELSWIIVESTFVHFEVTKDIEVLVFEGTLVDNKLVGEFKTKTERGTFDLKRP